jgi:hypothetical protein
MQPPEGNGAIGPSHFVELVNGRFSVYNKANGQRTRQVIARLRGPDETRQASLDFLAMSPDGCFLAAGDRGPSHRIST